MCDNLIYVDLTHRLLHIQFKLLERYPGILYHIVANGLQTFRCLGR